MALDKTNLTNLAYGNGMNLFFYDAGSDAIATVVAADYFLGAYRQLGVDDLIYVKASDDDQIIRVTASSASTVTTTATIIS